ncbi:UNVERIFIED_CONTAM: GBF-interacting protein 1 [Sesamum calycinum]|uniref:GBF-interacting protein 1 n=1 Tax=Sesamum calycinum TaxID=2727403 RepID=A0AAW2Q6Z7_9LAMI
MSTSRGSGAGNGGGVQAIPAGSRKMVQSLKEIVNCSEAEIYVTLKDCNMDPNEAVNRLLSQDPFHEVKSKREKKKEGKDTTESRSRSANNNSSRGGKIGADRYHGRGGSTPYSSESASLPGRSSYKKKMDQLLMQVIYLQELIEAEDLQAPGSFYSCMLCGSDGASSENKVSPLSMADAMPSGVQPTSGYQSAWVGVPGQVSMADIVKMGRPQSKVLSAPNASHQNFQGSSASASHHNLGLPEDHAPKDPELGIAPVQHISTNEEWPSIEKPPVAKVNPNPEHKVDSEQHLEASGVLSESISQAEEGDPEDDSGGASLFENDLYNNMGSYTQQAHDFHEVEEIGPSLSSVTRNLQQLSVQKDDGRFPSEEYAPSVVIPDHLQVQSADCSHLSFEPHSEPDISSVGHPDARSSEYYVDDSLRNAPDGGLFHRTGANAGSYDPSSASQPEELKPENAEVAHGNQYPFPSSNSGYAFDNGQHLNASFSQTSSQMQNLAPFPNAMQSYTNSLPSALSPANVHPSRESDLQYSPFPVTQSTSSKYGNSASSISGSAISMPEALKTAGFPSTQPAQQTLSGTNVATGPPLPQHLAVHPYSQPTLPLGPFTNMIGYPFLPQSYTYMPSAFQQTFSGNSTYHQSLAALLPQYKNNVSASSLPQSAAIASGYGAFGNTPTIPGNFPMNPPAGPSGTTLSYDDVLNSQYKDSSHLVSLQQNENPALWLHGANSRTMSAVPASTYYNYQGQNQQTGGGMRQAQQPSQNYGSLGYPNFYHSQTGIALDQQQNPRDAPLGGSQGQPKQSQIWQNSY